MCSAVLNSICCTSYMMCKTIVILFIFCFIKYNEGGVYDENISDFETTAADSPGNADTATRDGWPGYIYYPEIQGWLKLHIKPADWQTARMNCHDEDAVLATPWNSSVLSMLKNAISDDRNSPRFPYSTPIYIGITTSFPEGIYKYENGKSVLSNDPNDVATLASCGIYYANDTMAWVDCRQSFAYACYAPATAPARVCGDETLGYNLDERTGHCYKFHSISKAWNDAHTTCLDEGAHLAIVNSDEEAQVLVDLFAQYPYEKLTGTNPAWGVMAVGFYYWKEADKYVTIHGQTLEQAGYAKWSYGNPSSRGKSKELGGGMFRSGLLDDVNKSYEVPFICEKNPFVLNF